MIVKVDRTFQKDLRKIESRTLNLKIVKVIEAVQQAKDIHQIKDLKKLKGTTDNYRIRLGEYRLGIIIQGNTVEFIRCLHRKDIYRYFPK